MPQFEIFVDNKRYVTDAEQMTADQIKQLAGVPSNYELFSVHEKNMEPIGPTQILPIKNGDRFRAVHRSTPEEYNDLYQKQRIL
jgi:hypothetical protein